MLNKLTVFWDRISASYPQRFSLLYTKKKSFDRGLVDPLPQGRVLDAGCGHGDDVTYFAQRGFEEVYGIDSSPKMHDSAVKFSRRFNIDENLKRIHLQIGNIKNLLFEDKYFDVTCSFSTIDHIPKAEGREKAISELVRVTKPGGTIVLTFPNKMALASLLKQNEDVFVSPESFRGLEIVQICNRSDTNGAPEYSYEQTFSHDDLRDIVRQYDLKESKITTGVMTNCIVVASKTELRARIKSLDRHDVLLNHTHGHNITAAVERTIRDWEASPVEQRGLRIGLVAKRPNL
jgi:SAM-dependent methyltransferase